MQFWGVEVKSGEPLEVKPDGLLVHVSQASLGESRKNKSNESIYLHVTVDDKKLVLGKLLTEKIPHASFDLVFEKPFILSHDWKHGSVYFTGYRAEDPYQSDSEDSDNELRESLKNLAPNSGTQTVKSNEDVKPTEEDDEDSDDESDESSDEGDSDEEEMTITSADDDDNDEEDSDDSSDDGSPDKIKETPKKAESSKKRKSDSILKTSVPDKKAKLVTPQKTDGKKEAVNREATPHPSKQAGKAVANSDKSKQQTPKSGGSFPCKSCNRSFTSEAGLESHSKAKHSSGK